MGKTLWQALCRSSTVPGKLGISDDSGCGEAKMFLPSTGMILGETITFQKVNLPNECTGVVGPLYAYMSFGS